MAPETRVAAGTPLLEVRDVAKAFGGNRAVDGVSFTLHAGETLALIGPNGAGKSTLFNLLNGQLAPDAGSVTLLDAQGRRHSLAGRAPREIEALGVGRTFQVAHTFGSLTVEQNVQTALFARRGGLRTFWRLADGVHRDAARALLVELGLEAQASRAARELAYGDVKRLELAIALASAPRLLLMDEPTAGMAPTERHALMDLIARQVERRGMAVLFTEHSMDIVFRHAQRIVVLAQGRVIAEGDPAAVRSNAEVRRVYLGRDAEAVAA